MTKSIYRDSHRALIAKLIEARKQANLTQIDAAKLLGKTQSYLSKIESGQRRIDVVQLKEFARIYGKKLAYFLPE